MLHQLTAICHQLTAQGEMLLRVRRERCLTLAGLQARSPPDAGQHPHPPTFGRAGGQHTSIHPPSPTFRAKTFDLVFYPPTPDNGPLCLYWRIQKNLYIVLMSLMIIEDGYGLG